ncbi:UDP-N-acetylglucosamine 1-carboxyvinyltransferase [Acidimicrobium ferrooxidans]|nr:UDP-N-acetylglucosamine 1-carboxyvinyltransferase [Acidimicrobium ferrooxidans]
MEQFVVTGGARLEGRVQISGSKNAALPIVAATLLTDDPCRIEGVPDLHDMRNLLTILDNLGLESSFENGVISTRVVSEENSTAPYEHVRKMRASICVLGPLVAKRGVAEVSLPGGCVIGVRPIELHIKGLRDLGADIRLEDGFVKARCPELRGATTYLGGAFGSSVLGTANVMCAAVLARGRTIIENAACEPEVQDLAHFLNKMGAKVSGIGSHHLVIDGVKKLHGAEHRVIPDRIEAGTFMVAAAITGGDLTIEGLVLNHMLAVTDKLKEVGAIIDQLPDNAVRVRAGGIFKATDITTLPYPGFPTDMQAQLMALLAIASGTSVVTEKIYPDRFMHVPEYNRLGARIRKEGPAAIVEGAHELLSGAPVMASDLRASAGLVLMGLVAKGQTEINRVYHIDRGYESIDEKLRKVGGDVQRRESNLEMEF